MTSYHPGSRATAERWALRRAALWALLAWRLIALWGVRWDIQWHVVIGRDSFWIAPHVMTYAGVSGIVLVAFGILLWETGRPVGATGTRGQAVRRMLPVKNMITQIRATIAAAMKSHLMTNPAPKRMSAMSATMTRATM